LEDTGCRCNRDQHARDGEEAGVSEGLLTPLSWDEQVPTDKYQRWNSSTEQRTQVIGLS
jgi:hypothetical protein